MTFVLGKAKFWYAGSPFTSVSVCDGVQKCAMPSSTMLVSARGTDVGGTWGPPLPNVAPQDVDVVAGLKDVAAIAADVTDASESAETEETEATEARLWE